MTNKKNKNKKNQHKLRETIVPYEVKHSDTLGRYLVAGRNISSGETIMIEEPITIGPTLNVNNICCIGCFVQLESGNHEICQKCNFPICNVTCIGFSKYHLNVECNFFEEKKISETLPSSEFFDLIFPLRVLFLKVACPESFSIIKNMESHIEERKLNEKLWKKYENQFVKGIQGLTEFTEEDIQFVLGVIDVNCFELGNEKRKIRALYPSAFLMSHNCVCNTRHSDDTITNALKILACNDIKKGEPISINYGYTLQGTLMRRQYIYEGKYFWCNCKRCEDPSELRTYTSALVCKNCENGKVLSTDPLNQNALWKCNLCDLSLEGESVFKLLASLYYELESIGPHNVEKQEQFLMKYKRVLSANHYLFLSAKYSLCQVLGKMDGYVINELTEEYLRKKEAYCRQLLTIVSILEPGKSRLRGVLLYELHAPIMISSTRQIQQQKMSLEKFKTNIKEVIQLLSESFDILKLEPEGTSEYQTSLAAEEALNSITKSL